LKRRYSLEEEGKREVKGQSTRLQFVSLYSYNCVANSMACPEGAGRPLYREKGTCTLLFFGIWLAIFLMYVVQPRS
jgi:hypothetical protein